MTLITGSGEMRAAIRRFIQNVKADVKESGARIERSGMKILVRQPIRFTVPMENGSRIEPAELLEVAPERFTVSCNRYLECGALIALVRAGMPGALPARVRRSTRTRCRVHVEAEFVIEYDPDVYALGEQDTRAQREIGASCPLEAPQGLKKKTSNWLAKLFA